MAIPSGLFTTSSCCCFGRYFLRMVLLYPIMSCFDAKTFARCMKELRLMVKGGSWLMFSWLNQSTSPSCVGWSVSRSRAGVFWERMNLTIWEWKWQHHVNALFLKWSSESRKQETSRFFFSDPFPFWLCHDWLVTDFYNKMPQSRCHWLLFCKT